MNGALNYLSSLFSRSAAVPAKKEIRFSAIKNTEPINSSKFVYKKQPVSSKVKDFVKAVHEANDLTQTEIDILMKRLKAVKPKKRKNTDKFSSQKVKKKRKLSPARQPDADDDALTKYFGRITRLGNLQKQTPISKRTRYTPISTMTQERNSLIPNKSILTRVFQTEEPKPLRLFEKPKKLEMKSFEKESQVLDTPFKFTFKSKGAKQVKASSNSKTSAPKSIDYVERSFYFPTPTLKGYGEVSFIKSKFFDFEKVPDLVGKKRVYSLLPVENTPAVKEPVAKVTEEATKNHDVTSLYAKFSKQQENTWRCSICLVPNSVELALCQACRAPQPSAAVTEPTVAENSAAVSNVSTDIAISASTASKVVENPFKSNTSTGLFKTSDETKTNGSFTFSAGNDKKDPVITPNPFGSSAEMPPLSATLNAQENLKLAPPPLFSTQAPVANPFANNAFQTASTGSFNIGSIAGAGKKKSRRHKKRR